MRLFGLWPTGNTRVWDHRFDWTPQHLTAAQLRPLLYSYDELATEALDRLDRLETPGAASRPSACPHKPGPPQGDVLALVERHAEGDEVLGRLWKEVMTVPDWVDWEQIARGQQVVYQFKGQIILGLLYKSLLGGMGSSRVVETLARTGGFGVHVSKRRLLETLQHFMEVVDGLDSLRPRGKGHLSSVRVRLLHAAVRRRLLQLERRRPGYFDAQALGVPINDLHCIGTVAAYSAALVYMALPYQGVSMSAGQAADYLALWRWVGHLLGAPVDWMASPDSAKAMMESLMAAELDPSEKSRVLVSNVLTALADAPGRYSPRAYLAAQAYCLNGDRYARALGIPRPSLFYLLLFYLQSALLMAASHSYAWLPVRVRRKRDQRFRDAFAAVITNRELSGLGEPSTFNFQYIPQLGKSTELGGDATALGNKSVDAHRQVAALALALALAGLAIVWALHLAGFFRGTPLVLPSTTTYMRMLGAVY